jgi:hypothetical protein
VTVRQVRLSDERDFRIVANQATGRTLQPREAAEVTVRFEPGSAGAKSATLSVASDAPGPDRTRSLEGKAFDLKNLSMPPFLASGSETVQIQYEVDDPASVITGGTLEVSRKDRTAILSRALAAEERRHGPARIQFDGKIDAHHDFPDQYPTVEHSPYTVRVTATGAGLGGAVQVRREATFKVEVGTIELELGPESVLKDGIHKDVLKALAAEAPAIPRPDETKPKRIHLVSNLFKTNIAERAHDNNTCYDQYKRLWKDGPLVPIYAVLKVRKSDERSMVDAPKALGKAAVLWDYEHVLADLSGLHPKAKAFIAEALDVERTTSQPPGDNVYGPGGPDRGGKRNKAGDTAPIFPPSSAYPIDVQGFPFRVTTPGTRKWAAYSEPATTGSAEGKTGVIFRPSRIAGDAYKITVYLDPDKSLDKEGKLDPGGRAWTGTGVFQVWREVHVAKIFRKNDRIEPYDHNLVRPFYEKAYIRLVNKGGDPAPMPDYNANFLAVINAKGGLLKDHAVANPGAQLTAGDAAVTFKSFDDFKASYLGDKPASLRDRYHGLLVTGGYSHDNPTLAKQNYANKCQAWAKSVTLAACNAMMPNVATEGIVVFMFGDVSSNIADATAVTAGIALNESNATRTKGAYIQFKRKASYSPPDSIEGTIAHEMGHVLFLPHTRYETEAQDADAHDAAEDGCLMGYNFKVPRNFCGYCNLRLRGWDHTKLKPDAPDNAVRPKIEVTPPGAFPVADGRSASDPQTVTVKNVGDGTLTVSKVSIVNDGDALFEITENTLVGQPVGKNETKALKLVFKRQSPGEKTATLEIHSNAADLPRLVALSHEGKRPSISLDPTAKDFDQEPFTEQAVRVTNSGDAPLRVQRLERTGPDAAEFTFEDGAPGGAIEPGAFKTFKVKFNASIKGPKKAALLVHTNAAGSPTEMPLKGTARSKVELAAVEGVDGTRFGSVPVNTNSGPKRFRIKNAGTFPLTVASVAEDSGNFIVEGIATPLTLRGNEQREFTVKFRPQIAGLMVKSVSAQCDADEGQDCFVSGTGQPPPSRIEYEKPDTDSFGPRATTDPPLTKTFRIRNAGPGDVVVRRIAMSRSGDASFSITDPLTAEVTLRNGEAQEFHVAFKPDTAGVKVGIIEVESTATEVPAGFFMVTGVGS